MTRASASVTRPERELDRRIAALALPALGSIAAEPAYSLADTAIVGHLGRAPLDSLAIAAAALNLTAWLAIFLTTATTSAVAGLAAGRATERAVTADPAVRHAATVALLVAALTQPVAALAFVLDGLILGLSDYVAMRRAMILAIGAYTPMAVLVLRFHRLGLPGVWVALGLWLAARAALLGRRWRTQFGEQP